MASRSLCRYLRLSLCLSISHTHHTLNPTPETRTQEFGTRNPESGIVARALALCPLSQTWKVSSSATLSQTWKG